MNKYNIIFESKNLLYINVNENLINDYLTMVNDPEVQKCISHNTKVYTYEQELSWVKEKLSENAPIFSMIEKETGEYVGNVEIMHVRDGFGEIGIAITPLKQNKHYGTEAMTAITNYALNVMNLENVDLNVYKTNPRAIRCYEKAGFITDGIGKTEEDLHMTFMNYKLVPYTNEDFEFVYEVKKNAYKKYVEEYWGPWNEEIQQELFNKFIDTVKDDAYIIKLNDKSIGFYNGEKLEDGSYEIGNICIVPEYQGKGLGTRILKDIMKFHNGQDLHIQYFKQNPVGKLYERLGFIPNGGTTTHYQMVKCAEKKIVK